MMGTPVLILGDSGAGKSYSLRNFNPDDVMLLQCIPKMLPFKSAGWKLHGKLLPDGSKQRGNVLRSDNWETVLDTIYRMVQSKTRRVLIIDDFQVVMQHENMNRAYQTGYAKFTEMADHIWRIIMAATELPDDFRVYFRSHRRDRRENPHEDHREDAQRKADARGLFLHRAARHQEGRQTRFSHQRR